MNCLVSITVNVLDVVDEVVNVVDEVNVVNEVNVVIVVNVHRVLILF